MPIIGNVIGSASSGGAKTVSTVVEAPTIATFSLRDTAAVVGNMIGGGGSAPKTMVLRTENGEEMIAVFVGNEVIFDAVPDDIREGKVAASAHGKVVGVKVIPEYTRSYALIDTSNGLCLGTFAGTTSVDDSKFIEIDDYDEEYISKYYINGSWYEDSAGTIPWSLL